jgi:hypothetical protein
MNPYRAAARTLARRLLTSPVATVRALTVPATRPTAPAAPALQPAPEPTGLYEADEMPDLGTIESAAADYERAAEQARRADRSKRGAKKILDRLPAGTYGAWHISRVSNAREVADLETIRQIFATHGLGPVPMKPCAASLKVTRATSATDTHTAELLAA